MSVVRYDKDLEHVAECWAMKCNPTHDLCRRTRRFQTVGQNMHTTIGQECDQEMFRKAIEMWYAQISGMTLGCIIGYGSCEAVSAYSQVRSFAQFLSRDMSRQGETLFAKRTIFCLSDLSYLLKLENVPF